MLCDLVASGSGLSHFVVHTLIQTLLRTGILRTATNHQSHETCDELCVCKPLVYTNITHVTRCEQK